MSLQPLDCCAAPGWVNPQTGRPVHYEDCLFAEPISGTLPRPEVEPEPEPEPDPMESRRILVQYEILAARNLWSEYTNVTGMNPWARNEGQVSDGEMLPITEAQAVQIGLMPAPPTSTW